MLPAANPATARVLVQLGADTLILPTDLTLAQIAAMRTAGSRSSSAWRSAGAAPVAAAAPATHAAVSRAFGTPKPTLANSYEPELLNLRTFPTLMGYSSRIMAESWESNSLYWAALADELSVSPTQLNVRIPEWTRKLVEQIFASHLEDWPAVLKSLRVVGDDIRAQTRAQATEQKAALQ